MMWMNPLDSCNFSLPTQRCFCSDTQVLQIVGLFSSYAEVFPLCHSVSSFFSPFLCLRRGVSAFGRLHRLIVNFSLPTQRCFQLAGRVGSLGVLFSAYAEVFLRFQFSSVGSLAFLCLRRGVSKRAYLKSKISTFSLPTQRCFLCGGRRNA